LRHFAIAVFGQDTPYRRREITVVRSEIGNAAEAGLGDPRIGVDAR